MWAAEVEPYPIAVTRSRFPHMKHLGDVTKINGADIAPVDIITFGSPCQDLSVAGKRAAADAERGAGVCDCAGNQIWLLHSGRDTRLECAHVT